MRINNYPESGRGLGHVTLTIFGSTVGCPSDSLASCFYTFKPTVLSTVALIQCYNPSVAVATLSTVRLLWLNGAY